RLQVPSEIVERFPEQLRDDALPFHLDGERLAADWRGNEVELTFPQRRRGTFLVVLAEPYRIAFLQQMNATVRVPVISLVNRPFDSLRLEVPTGGTAGIDVTDDQWTPLPTAVDSKAWITSSVMDAVEIGLDHSLESVPQQVSI